MSLSCRGILGKRLDRSQPSPGTRVFQYVQPPVRKRQRSEKLQEGIVPNISIEALHPRFNGRKYYLLKITMTEAQEYFGTKRQIYLYKIMNARRNYLDYSCIATECECKLKLFFNGSIHNIESIVLEDHIHCHESEPFESNQFLAINHSQIESARIHLQASEGTFLLFVSFHFFVFFKIQTQITHTHILF